MNDCTRFFFFQRVKNCSKSKELFEQVEHYSKVLLYTQIYYTKGKHCYIQVLFKIKTSNLYTKGKSQNLLFYFLFFIKKEYTNN